jgi:hypothetical protein
MDLSAGTTRVATTTSNPPRRNPGLAEYPQAKWVTKEIMEERRRSRCCLRCGNVGHPVSDCKFRPAVNLNRAPRVNTTTARLNTAAETFIPTKKETEGTKSDSDESLNSTP